MKVSIILPAYKEAENLKKILPNIHEILQQTTITYEILVIDTMNALDNTEDICLSNNAICIRRENGNLYGDAIRTGFMKARGEFIVVMDADGSHNPKDIIRFYNEMLNGNYSLIIGSRYCSGGYTDNNFILRLMSHVLNITYRILFGLKVKDVSDSYRMYKAKTLENLTLDCDNFDIVEEILIKLSLTTDAFTVKEIPIVFSKRDEGESKRDLIKFIRSYFKTISKLMRIKHSCKHNSHINTKS